MIAIASDGYRVVFSWPELFNSEASAAVLVVFERDGEPLADREVTLRWYRGAINAPAHAASAG